MNVKTKTTFIIFFTLLLGVALGTLLNRALLHRRIGRALSWRNPAALASNLEDLLSPQGEHAEEIRKILGDHVEALMKVRESSRQEMQVLTQSLENSLDPYLTAEQKQNLQRKSSIPFGRDKRFQGFPPGMGPQGRVTNEMDVLSQRLDLSPEQRSMVEKLLQPSRSFAPFGTNDANRNLDRTRNPSSNQPPTPFGLRGMIDIEDILVRGLEHQKEFDQAITDILSDSQKQEYAKMIQERQQRLHNLLKQP